MHDAEPDDRNFLFHPAFPYHFLTECGCLYGYLKNRKFETECVRSQSEHVKVREDRRTSCHPIYTRTFISVLPHVMKVMKTEQLLQLSREVMTRLLPRLVGRQ